MQDIFHLKYFDKKNPKVSEFKGCYTTCEELSNGALQYFQPYGTLVRKTLLFSHMTSNHALAAYYMYI